MHPPAGTHILDPNFNPYFVPTLGSSQYNRVASNPTPTLNQREHHMNMMIASGGGMTLAPMYQPSAAQSSKDSMATSTGWENNLNSDGGSNFGGPMMVQNQAGHAFPVTPQGAMMPPPPHSPSLGDPVGPQASYPNERSTYQSQVKGTTSPSRWRK